MQLHEIINKNILRSLLAPARVFIRSFIYSKLYNKYLVEKFLDCILISLDAKIKLSYPF